MEQVSVFNLTGVVLSPHHMQLFQQVCIQDDEWLSCNQIYSIVAQAAGVEPHLVHVPSEVIAAYDPQWGASLLGDKAHSMIFDNSKIRRLVPEFHPVIPFWQGAQEIIAWHDADPSRQVVDPKIDQVHDRLVAATMRSFSIE